MPAAQERHIVIVGASDKPSRYANKAQKLLMEKGFPVIPVSRNEKSILGVPAHNTMEDIHTPVDTITLYIAPQHQQELIPQQHL